MVVFRVLYRTGMEVVEGVLNTGSGVRLLGFGYQPHHWLATWLSFLPLKKGNNKLLVYTNSPGCEGLLR